MKKSTLFFLSTLIAVFLSASTSYAAIYSSESECRANCSTGCGGSGSFVVCFAPGNNYCVSDGVSTAGPYWTYSDCHAVETRKDSDDIIKSCYQDGSYYTFQFKFSSCGTYTPSCPAGCSTCSSSTTCTTCDGGFYLSSGSCLACPANATCNGSSTYNCNSGYLRQGNACVSCPANATCNGSSSFTCNSAYWQQGETCASCPANATCNGSSTFTCNSGYRKSGTACVKDRTVRSCPSRMTLSSDGCCCINK